MTIQELCQHLIEHGYIHSAQYGEKEGCYLLEIVTNRGSVLRLAYDDLRELHDATLILSNGIKSTMTPIVFNHARKKTVD